MASRITEDAEREALRERLQSLFPNIGILTFVLLLLLVT